MTKYQRVLINVIFFLFLIVICSPSSLRNKAYSKKANKEIAGSLLELITSPKKEIVIKDSPQKKENNSFLFTQTKSKQIYHTAFPTPETTKMRRWEILTLIIFGTLYLLIRTGYNSLKNLNRFFAKGVLSLSNQILLLSICLSILIVCYVYGTFDSIYINWEYLIGSIGIFILCWILYNIILIVLSISANRKWNELELQGISFHALKSKIKENQLNNKSNADLFDTFEFLIMKRYFFVPLFPVLKSSSLRKDLKFSYYLEQCLLGKLRQFFKITWTGWVGIIVTLMFWNVFIVPASILAATIFLMTIPLVGILISLGIYFYLNCVYRRIIKPINEDNMGEFIDIDYDSNELYQSMGYPEYIVKLINDDQAAKAAKNVGYSIHEHLHQRAPSLYEDLIIFGQSGVYFLLNIFQCCSILLICWCIGTFARFGDKIAAEYSNFAYFFLVIGLIIFVSGQLYLTVIGLKWITLISSVEMKRNDKCVMKMVNNQLKKAGELSNEIVTNFKKIYFDIKTINYMNNSVKDLNNESNQLILEEEEIGKENEFELQFANIGNMIKVCFNRFDKVNQDSILIKDELRPFLKSCGNLLNEKEIEFLLHLVPNAHELNGKLTLAQLCSICGALINFRQKKQSDIVKFAFDHYYEQNPQMYRDNILKWVNIEEFFTFYKDYFNQKHLKYIRDESSYLGDKFTLDEFITLITTPNQYYSY